MFVVVVENIIFQIDLIRTNRNKMCIKDLQLYTIKKLNKINSEQANPISNK